MNPKFDPDSIRYALKEERAVSKVERDKLRQLLNTCFPGSFKTRHYYKQIPHFRILLWSGHSLIGQIACDFRIMASAGRALRCMGIIDLCILESYRGQSFATALVARVEEEAIRCDSDFLILFADNPTLYQRLGFQQITTECSWLKIDEHKSLGIGRAAVPEFMVKAVSDKSWSDGALDMLGYLY
jgi:GNAT superfamily N-acetyltransferase